MIEKKNTDVLAIGAHPDDIELGCGGTIAKLVKLGYQVTLCDLTQGELGTRGTKEIRLKEANKAAKILGVVSRYNLRIPDGNIELNKKNLHKLITLIRELRPKVLFIPTGIERHPDHIHANILCKEAWFYSGLVKLKSKLNNKLQEPFRPHHYFEYMQWIETVPKFIVDVSDTFEIKMKAIRTYLSQLYNPSIKGNETKISQPDFLDIIETRCKYHGNRIGVKYGEPFTTALDIGFDDPLSILISKG